MNSLIIIPAYNVEENLCYLLKQLDNYRDDILFIDDGSTDNTGKLIKEYNYNLIKNEKNMGVSKAVMKGLSFAKEKNYSSVVLMDADGQHNPKYLPAFIDKLNNSDFVFGCRFSYDSITPTLKLTSNLLAAMIVNKIWHCNYFDISCGFKGFKVDDFIFEIFKNSSGYEIVFDVFFYALSSNKEISIVNMEAVYDNSSFLSTRQEELVAFLSALKRHCNKDYYKLNLDVILSSISNLDDFTYSINDITFYGFYISCKNTYIIQSDLKKLYLHMQNIGSNNND